jgi:hypothetical protein
LTTLEVDRIPDLTYYDHSLDSDIFTPVCPLIASTRSTKLSCVKVVYWMNDWTEKVDFINWANLKRVVDSMTWAGSPRVVMYIKGTYEDGPSIHAHADALEDKSKEMGVTWLHVERDVLSRYE